jgi:DNA end-binding protein Ku
MAARAIWSGSISFGLVNVPVKVVTAVRHKEVRFHMLHDRDGGRIQQKRVCSVDGAEVPYEEIAKGYEIKPDEYVMIEPEELKQADPARSETIEISDFVDVAQIDPIYYDSTYYLVPAKGGVKAYSLLVEAMRNANRVAIARVVMREKEHLVALRVIEDALAMTTLLYHDEIVKVADLEEVPKEVKPPAKKEVEMAEKLIEALESDFEPAKYKDEYRARVMELIEAKAEGKRYTSPKRAEEKRPADLVEALKASLEAAKSKHKAGGPAEA